MNKVILMGRLTRDPEVQYTQGNPGTAVGRYSLAVSRPFKRDGEPEADFFNIVAFGSRGEFAGKYFRKGMQVAIVGELRNNSYTDRDGHKRTTTDIIATEQYFAESRSQNQQNNQSVATPDFAPVGAGYQTPTRNSNALHQARTLTPQSDKFTPIDEDFSNEELPF